MLKLSSYINLPEHLQPGGFDHADIHPALQRIYLAHTCNNSLDVIDCAAGSYTHSIPNLTGIAGALVSGDMVFTSNRGENSIGIFSVGDEHSLIKTSVGICPNGLAFDPGCGLLLVANVGDSEIPASFTLSMVDIKRLKMTHSIPVMGRTRWAVFDALSDSFYVNIADPATIVVIAAKKPDRIAAVFSIPAAGPHGLDLDIVGRRLFCVCDSSRLVTVHLPDGKILADSQLSGKPDVIFFHPTLNRLYVAVGEPGVIDVFDTVINRRIEIVETEKGAHTLALDKTHNKVYAFLPQSHRAAVFVDQ